MVRLVMGLALNTQILKITVWLAASMINMSLLMVNECAITVGQMLQVLEFRI